MHVAFESVLLRLASPVLVAVALLCATTGGAPAHFADNFVVRSFLVTSEGEEVLVYQGVPVPLLFGDRLQDVTRLPQDARAGLVYADPSRGDVFLSVDAIAADPAAFEARLADHATWTHLGDTLRPKVLGWRLLSLRSGPDPSTRAEAQALLGGPTATRDVNLTTAIVYFALGFDVPADARLRVQSALPPLTLPPWLQLENHVVDLRDVTGPRAFFVPGQLEAPLTLVPSTWEVFMQFVNQGMIHVFGGLDHLLLIVCVALASLALKPLVLGLTGFTIGHSITLIASFLGITTPGSTFIIVVETVVAATVAFAAIQGLRKRPAHPLALVLVGLFHGFGFSFVLREILGPESPALVISLLAFNVGIEVAQILIVTAIVGLSRAAHLLNGGRLFDWAGKAALFGAFVISVYWIFDRLSML